MASRAEIKHDLVIRMGGKCADCGGSFPDCCFDFDHKFPLEKIFNVGRKIGRVPLDILLTEIEHCDLVCANCHRIRTAASHDVKTKMRHSHEGRNGRRHSKATKEKIRLAATGRVLSVEVRSKISRALAGNTNRVRTALGRFK